MLVFKISQRIGGGAWPKSSHVEVTFSYSSLEYSVIKVVGPRKKAQNPKNLP